LRNKELDKETAKKYRESEVGREKARAWVVSHREEYRPRRREWARVWRDRNREKHNRSAVERTERRRQFIASLKNRPCADCGGLFHFSAMDFDHARGAKVFTIAQKKFKTIEAILDEVAKCELVCSNCHRVRTWKRARGLSC
jgi:hypothetical protein